jgi:lipid-binding SYLF domain-containing protein
MRTRAAIAAFLTCATGLAWADSKEAERLDACRQVVREVMGVKEDVPRDLIDKAECVAVIPGVKKAAAGVGARFGYGAVSCRSEGGFGPWGPPLMISLKGGSFGFQVGGQEADLVLLVMNPKGIDYLLRSKFTLGADASVAAGPVGRTAEAATDAQMHAEILSYSRSRGLFAGLSLEGAVVKPDEKANFGVYGEDVLPGELLTKSGRDVPKVGKGFVDELNRIAPRPSGWKL